MTTFVVMLGCSSRLERCSASSWPTPAVPTRSLTPSSSALAIEVCRGPWPSSRRSSGSRCSSRSRRYGDPRADHRAGRSSYPGPLMRVGIPRPGRAVHPARARASAPRPGDRDRPSRRQPGLHAAPRADCCRPDAGHRRTAAGGSHRQVGSLSWRRSTPYPASVGQCPDDTANNRTRLTRKAQKRPSFLR